MTADTLSLLSVLIWQIASAGSLSPASAPPLNRWRWRRRQAQFAEHSSSPAVPTKSQSCSSSQDRGLRIGTAIRRCCPARITRIRCWRSRRPPRASRRCATTRRYRRERWSAALESRAFASTPMLDDAVGWVTQLRADKRFSRVIVAGTAKGRSSGCWRRAAQADAFVSIAGASPIARRKCCAISCASDWCPSGALGGQRDDSCPARTGRPGGCAAACRARSRRLPSCTVRACNRT